eukprot:scaffold21373_cov72-Skeletonema_dohrnii-CCMP3373.AAC.1
MMKADWYKLVSDKFEFEGSDFLPALVASSASIMELAPDSENYCDTATDGKSVFLMLKCFACWFFALSFFGASMTLAGLLQLLEWICSLNWNIISTNMLSREKRIRNSNRGSVRRSHPFVIMKQLLSLVTPFLFAALVGKADAFIEDCINVNPAQWIEIEYGWNCQSYSWCPSGWSWEAYETAWGYCSRDGCKREVCLECVAGAFLSGFSEGYATSCTYCTTIKGCIGGSFYAVSSGSDEEICLNCATCSNESNSRCATCDNGRFLSKASSPNAADACPLCTPIDGCQMVSCESSSDQTCVKCKDGYFVSYDKKKCTKCPAGSFCDGLKQIDCWEDGPYYCPIEGMGYFDIMTYKFGWAESKCPESKFGNYCEESVTCVTEREQGVCAKDKCWNFKGDGTCTECDVNYAGKNCEHSVCRSSELSTKLSNEEYVVPDKFDFSKYKAENVEFKQESTSTGEFGIVATFRPISREIEQHILQINGIDTQVSTAPPECDNEDHLAKMNMEVLNELGQFGMAVGTSLKACIKGMWKDKYLDLTSGTWKGEGLNVGKDRSNPVDLFNTVGIEGATIAFTVDGKSFTGKTNENGELSQNILIDNLDAGTTHANLQITNVTTSSGDFVLCSSPPIPGRPCDESQQKKFPSSEVVMHLNKESQDYFIVDKAAVAISGKVIFSSPGQAADDCGIKNAKVIAIDTRGERETVITNTTTDEAGDFNLVVAKQTQVRLKVEYFNHSFVATATPPFDGIDDLVSTEEGKGKGFIVTEEIAELKFEDTTKSKITITSAVTECAFDIGSYDLKLTVPGCSAAAGEYKVDRESYTVEVPAHVYDFDLAGFSGYGSVDGNTIKERFKYMFPDTTRKLNVTAKSENVHFTFHPDVELEMKVNKGLFAPETFDKAGECSKNSNEDPPFDFALEGNSYASLRFGFRQNYPGSVCEILPEGFRLKVLSNLNREEDPCSTNNDGCEVDVMTEESQGINQTLAKQIVFSGEPISFGVENGGKTISDYVSSFSISYTLFNDKYYDGDGQAGKKESTILLLGHKSITKESLVSYFQEGQLDNVPLLYLYALPPGASSYQVQTVTFDLATTTVTNVFATSDFSQGGGGSVGIKNQGDAYLCVPFIGCAIKIASGENTFTTGGNRVDTSNTNYRDTSTTEITSKGLTLSTPAGLFGDEGDMVLLIGTVAKFVQAVSVSFNETTCMIEEMPSVVWGSATESLLFYSKRDCEREFDKLQKTIDVNVNNTDQAAIELVRKSEQSVKKWSALFEHWHNDRQQAKNNEVDLRDLVGESGSGTDKLNTFTFGASTIGPLTRTTSTSDSSVTDYTSTGSVVTSNTNYEWETLFGSQFIAGPVGSTQLEFTSSTSNVNSKTEENGSSKTVSATFVETDAGDTLCVEVFQSPHSGTYIFEVCGGATMCPHVSGTDARQKFSLSVTERPPEILQQDSGRIVLEISTLDMLDKDIDSLDVVLELDASASLFPVRFDIGSASLNRPLELKIDARTTQPVYINFERLDPNLKSIAINGNVRSKCDSQIFEEFSVGVRWSSQCPPVIWGGDLSAMDSYFEITSGSPDLQLTAVNPTGTRWNEYEGMRTDIDLWYRLHDTPTDPWKVIPHNLMRLSKTRDSASSTGFADKEDKSGSASLWLSADENNLFQNGRVYEFELRALCYKVEEGGTEAREVGETRSNPRIGIVDLQGPKIISWKVTHKLNKPTLGFPVCSIIFDEAVDCSHQSLKATITAKRVNTTRVGGVYCTGGSQQLNIVLNLKPEDDVDLWSGSDVDVSISGIRDLFGNVYGESGDLFGRRELRQSIPVTFTLPIIPAFSGAERPWIMPSQEIVNATVAESRRRAFPSGTVLTTSHMFEEPGSDLPSPLPSSHASSFLTRTPVNTFVAATVAKTMTYFFL